MSTKRIGFVFLFRWAEQLMCDCSPEERHEALDALLEYARNKTVPTAWASPLSKALFCGFKREYDDMEDDYDEKCRKNKENINSRWHKDGDKDAYDRIQSNTSEYDRKHTPKMAAIARPQDIDIQGVADETGMPDEILAEDCQQKERKKESNKERNKENIYNNSLKKECTNVHKKKSIPDDTPLTLQFDNPQHEKTRFEKFQDFLKDECPYINEHLKPLTEEKFQRLLNAYGAEIMCIVCRNIENRVDLRKRYKDLFLTMNNWCKFEKARREDGKKQITR